MAVSGNSMEEVKIESDQKKKKRRETKPHSPGRL